jgi:plastocyanin
LRVTSSATRLAGIVLAALMLSQCGTSTGSPARTPVTHRILIDGTQFVPATLTVHEGDSVVWVNADPFPHTATAATATSAAGHFDSKEIAPQQSWTYTATVKGEFPYLCTLHQTMKGTLRVE